jgi:N6-L-threonylcarbamoyladenine synthase
MIRAIAEEHDASFRAVPGQYAVDNGAMIAWTGILAHKHGLATPMDRSFVKLRWRLDEVEVPWRS